MFWFYIIILSSHIINGLLTGFARAILRNTGPWSFSTALASSGCTKTAVLYFSVWPSHPVNKPLIQSHMISPSGGCTVNSIKKNKRIVTIFSKISNVDIFVISHFLFCRAYAQCLSLHSLLRTTKQRAVRT